MDYPLGDMMMSFVKTLPIGDDVFVVSKWSDTHVEKMIPLIQGSRRIQGYHFDKKGDQVNIDSIRVDDRGLLKKNRPKAVSK
jgi:hypothetical protein